ncbi:EamA-like transporter family protein [Leeuwenhoekiella aestuarii]|uniref:EamA-like transporter family protein n=1 Tax=Leeuwenhoekiella aestuarii TaxID=2249426 RepID=A0A4Q0NQU8_9FLAO|nr:DMT family transporter [Leeuwenhoekiella aestuarii]RXG11430.1 EamA-like transporter family protein [Leeuwenhoekiella aestuarii]RXG12167.1 EamA-like transporter family protein [Leeuwenhoekiella aestuarii]
MALIAGAAMALYSIIYRNIPLEKKPSSQLASFFTFFVGSTISILIIGFSGDSGAFINSLDINALYLFLALGILATLLPTLCYAYASSVLASVTVTSLRLLTPLLAAFLAIIFLAEIPDFLFWPGALILLMGLFLIIKSK